MRCGRSWSNRLLSVVLATLSLLTFAVAARAQPSVQWRRSDSFLTRPDPPFNAQTREQSGEDWWFAHANSYDNTQALNGYIAAGFSTFTEYAPSEAPTGCLVTTLGSPQCWDFETNGNRRGQNLANLALVAPDGQSQLWYTNYVQGWFNDVIQTSDGGYLAVGTTAATRDVNSNPLFYNPNQTLGFTTDLFGNGAGCDIAAPNNEGVNKRHTVVVKTNAAGWQEWAYIYGVVPWRDSVGVVDPGRAYSEPSEGFAVMETSSGHFRVVGGGVDPSNTCNVQGQAQAQGRMFMIEVDALGQWVSGGFYGTNHAHSQASAIIGRGGSDTRYYVAGNQSAAACGGPQKFFLMKFDEAAGPAAPAPPTPQWIRTDLDSSEGQNQRADDVQIAANGDLLLPAIIRCGGHCVGAGFNSGEGKVYRMDDTGTVINSCELGTVLAYDLKLRVAPTADNGFGAVSSTQVAAPEGPHACTPDGVNYDWVVTDTWNTDAFVAKCNACGSVDWSTTFDVDDLPAGDYPDDRKKQECVYSITEGDDGGFVISGNNSFNFDDSYMAKLDPGASSAQVCCKLGCGAHFCPSDLTAKPMAMVCNSTPADHSYDYGTEGLPTTGHGLTCSAPSVDGPLFSTAFQSFGLVETGTCKARQVTLERPPVFGSGDTADYRLIISDPVGHVAFACIGSAKGIVADCAISTTGGGVGVPCPAGKLTCVAKKMAAAMSCYAKAAKRGTAVAPECLAKAEAGYDGGGNTAKGCFAKLEARYGEACVTLHDADALASHVDGFVQDVVTALDPSFPSPTHNGCTAAKERCVLKKAVGMLKCHAKAQKSGEAFSAACLQKASARLDSCFAKAEAKGGCVTTNDSASLGSTVDAFSTTVVCDLADAGPLCLAPTPVATPTPTVTPTP